MNSKENMKRAELKDRLDEAMQLRNIKPVELSEKVGIPKSMVSYYLSGKTKPKADRVYDIAKFLNVSEAWLMGYDVPRERMPEQKKNDDLVKVIARLRSDPAFYKVVTRLDKLSADEFSSIDQLISVLMKE